jgi:hypothetical protein
MNKTDYHYIHFPASLLADVIERKEKALTEIIITFEGRKAVKGHPYCSVKISMLNEYITNPKSENEWIELICFLAIKSILGKKKIIKTNYLHIISRMLGLASFKDLINIKLTESQLKLLAQYTKKIDEVNKVDKSDIMRKAKMKGLLERIKLKWKVNNYARYTRGIYVSVVMNDNQMVKYCEDRKETNRIKEQKKAQNIAYLNYKATLNPRIKSTEFE